jgi:hypothetical protein
MARPHHAAVARHIPLSEPSLALSGAHHCGASPRCVGASLAGIIRLVECHRHPQESSEGSQLSLAIRDSLTQFVRRWQDDLVHAVMVRSAWNEMG